MYDGVYGDAGRGLRVHGLRSVLLREDILADCLRGLLTPEFTEQMDNFRVNVDRTDFAALGGYQDRCPSGAYSKGFRRW